MYSHPILIACNRFCSILIETGRSKYRCLYFDILQLLGLVYTHGEVIKN